MDRFAERTGRAYKLFDYVGAPTPSVIVMMGSGAEAAHETVEHLNARGEKVGLVKVRLFRPFSVERFIEALPDSGQEDRGARSDQGAGQRRRAAVPRRLHRGAEAKHAGSASSKRTSPRSSAGATACRPRSSPPPCVKAVFDNLDADDQTRKNHFTVGIVDDVTHTSLPVDDPDFTLDQPGVVEAVFYGLGSDGTVGANKNSIKIIGEQTDHYAQGYFVYDSKKSGSQTVSHLRFGPEPIRSTYLISRASFVACHQFTFLEKYDVLASAAGRDRSCSTPRTRPRRSGTTCPARCSRPSSTRSSSST